MRGTLLTFLLAATLLSACGPVINNFEECVAAGYPVMESYPRQCTADGTVYVEEIPPRTPEFVLCDVERPDVCTREYTPVCALQNNGIQCITAPCPTTDAVTKSNPCTACSDEEVRGYYEGSCEEQRFVVCGEELVTGFDARTLAEDAGWTCMDICPANMDSFTTQTGVEMCITRYDEETIATWESCTRSTEDCDCVRATETTNGDEISLGYRCVPELYAERLLFRSGQDRLDSSGEQSVVIA